MTKKPSAWPLAWPAGWPRTRYHERAAALNAAIAEARRVLGA